jgi:DNA processing protein
MEFSDLSYWIAISQLQNWKTEKINNLITKILSEENIPFQEFFSDFEKNGNVGKFSEKEIYDLTNAKNNLPNYSFLAEELISQGFEIINILSDSYPKTLKENLGNKYSPPVIYIKGNKQIFEEESAAIVGSRDASVAALNFTDNIAKNLSKEFKVIVSGFAKGVDKQALYSSLKYIGRSIIVLPQGILTFGSGINKYYEQILEGNVVVLSTFYPKAPWSVQFAMARNPIIYGLAKYIYVAESNEKGGTWSGVIDGLRKGRTIYVRKPEENEKNANELLIKKGAVPVDFNGKIIELEVGKETLLAGEVRDELAIEKMLVNLISNGVYSAKEIISKTGIDWSPMKVSKFLSGIESIKVINSNPRKYTLTDKVEVQDSLFD